MKDKNCSLNLKSHQEKRVSRSFSRCISFSSFGFSSSRLAFLLRSSSPSLAPRVSYKQFLSLDLSGPYSCTSRPDRPVTLLLCLTETRGTNTGNPSKMSGQRQSYLCNKVFLQGNLLSLLRWMYHLIDPLCWNDSHVYLWV